MDSASFNNLISSVEEASFDDDKVSTILSTIQSVGRISPQQVVQLMGLISFEDGQLKVAKQAYRAVSREYRGSYASVVGKALSFSDAKAELNEYIRQF
ncbi:hypothetical protein I4U23_019984 [Adineta vaga]|nr:hypothetical protein I4U23_019984 [Adineta vaga]